MISITGTFSYQPPGQDRRGFIPATFSIVLAIVGEDGVPVIDQRNQLGRLKRHGHHRLPADRLGRRLRPEAQEPRVRATATQFRSRRRRIRLEPHYRATPWLAARRAPHPAG